MYYNKWKSILIVGSVEGRVKSDKGIIGFDASRWLAAADSADIIHVAGQGWLGADGDAVAEYLSGSLSEPLFPHSEDNEAPNEKKTVSYQIDIDPYTAMFWLIKNRPDVAYEIEVTSGELPEFDRSLFEVERHRFSTTQGELTIRYDGDDLGRFGDTYKLREDGEWSCIPEDDLVGVAKRLLVLRHISMIPAPRSDTIVAKP